MPKVSLLGGHPEPLSAARSSATSMFSNPPPMTPSSSRASTMLSSVVPLLRRHDADATPTHSKAPLLTLKLSSSSFLDANIRDDVTEQALYTIRTKGSTTTVKRADPWDGDTTTAEIRWPSGLPQATPAKGKTPSDDVSIRFRGNHWKGSETFLKKGNNANAPRKFSVPNFPNALKWKRMGDAYWCTTSAVKGPIASFEPSAGPFPPTLQVFETFHDKRDARPMLVHHGVSILLLDYLLMTAFFLITDVQEWIATSNGIPSEISMPSTSYNFRTLSSMTSMASMADSLPPVNTPANVSTSDLQWRKIMYGEPLYPKKSRSSASSASTNSDGYPTTPVSTGPLRAAGRPGYPSIRTSSPNPSQVDSDDPSNQVYFSPLQSRPASPSAESVFYPRSAIAAPSHNYIDPSYYNESDVPPVPPIPAHFSQLSHSHSSSSSSKESASGAGPRSRISRAYSTYSRPSSSHSIMSSGRLRDLPLPPPIPNPVVHRPQSTPPHPITSPTSPHGQELSTSTTSTTDVSASEPLVHPMSIPISPLSPSRTSPALAPVDTGLGAISSSPTSSVGSSSINGPRRPSRQLPQPPLPPIPPSAPPSATTFDDATFDPPSASSSSYSNPVPQLGRSRSHSFHHHGSDKRSPTSGRPTTSGAGSVRYRQRTLPAPPTAVSPSGQPSRPSLDIGSSQDSVPATRAAQHRHSISVKEHEEDMSWVHTLTSPRDYTPLVPLPAAAYDMPPPAYNTINFSSTGVPDGAVGVPASGGAAIPGDNGVIGAGHTADIAPHAAAAHHQVVEGLNLSTPLTLATPPIQAGSE